MTKHYDPENLGSTSQALSSAALSVFIATALVLSSYQALTTTQTVTLDLIYYFLLLGTAGFLAAKAARAELRAASFSARRRSTVAIAAGVALFALSASLIFRHLHDHSVWLDEEAQAHFSAWLIDSNFVRVAAKEQQQPPIAYVLTAFSQKLFGASELGIRFFPALAGSLVPAAGFWLVWRIFSGQLLLPLAAGLLLASNGWLVRMSVEGRPPAIAALSSLLFLHLALGYLERPGRPAYFAVLGGAVVFLLSAGFQPLVFLGAFLIVLLPFLFFAASRAAAARLGSALLIALLAFLPLLLITADQSQRFLQTNLASLANSAREALRSASPSLLSERYLWALGDYKMVWVLSLFPALGAAGLAWRRRALPGVPLAATAALCLFVSVFPLLFQVIYFTFVSWNWSDRYYLTYVPAVLLSMTANLCLLREALPGRAASLAAMLALGALLWPAGAYRSLYESAQKRQTDVDWRGIYAYFKEQGRPGDQAFALNLEAPGGWNYCSFFATAFYYPAPYEPVRLRAFFDDRLANEEAQMKSDASSCAVHEALKKTSAPRTHFAFILPGPAPTVDLKGMTSRSYDRVLLVTTEYGARKVFTELRAAIPLAAWNYLLSEVLLNFALREGDLAQARRRLEELRRVDVQGRLRLFIEKYQERIARATSGK